MAKERRRVTFGDNPPVLSTLLTMVEALNRSLAGPDRQSECGSAGVNLSCWSISAAIGLFSYMLSRPA